MFESLLSGEKGLTAAVTGMQPQNPLVTSAPLSTGAHGFAIRRRPVSLQGRERLLLIKCFIYL